MQFTSTFVTMTAAFAGLSAAAPASAGTALEERFVPGQCGVHVEQFQKNQGSTWFPRSFIPSFLFLLA